MLVILILNEFLRFVDMFILPESKKHSYTTTSKFLIFNRIVFATHFMFDVISYRTQRRRVPALKIKFSENSRKTGKNAFLNVNISGTTMNF